MAVRYSPQFLDELRSRLDIVQVVGTYVPLKKNGSKHWGLCPFHNEKTASFSVDARKQMYYCFGCKAGGTVIQFVSAMEHTTFPETVRLLAERAHMELPEEREDPTYEERRSRRERLYEVNKTAARYYHNLLWEPAGAEVLNYFHRRGLTDSVIRRFGLGASPDGRDTLTAALLRDGIPLQDLVDAGLTYVRDESRRDMFRNRAMFPIIDPQGHVLGFGGRALGDVQPKYLNTSDTPAFNKRYMVYGANLLHKTRNLSRVILVEGYMDVVSLMQFGVEGVVATLGTALTVDQARLLKRYAPEVWLSYDGDSAGQHAILRGLDIMEEAGIPVKVLDFPDKLDPDEFIRRDGPEAFKGLVPMQGTTYRMRLAQAKQDMTTQEGRTAYAKECAELLKKVSSPLDRENYLREIAARTGFSREVLMAEINMAPAEPEKTEGWQRPYVHRETQEFDRTQAALLSLLATSLLPPGTVTAEDFTDEQMRRMASGLLSGASLPSVLESEEEQHDRASQILASQTEVDESQALTMAEECLKKLRLDRISQRLEEARKRVGETIGAEKQAAMAEFVRQQRLMNELKNH